MSNDLDQAIRAAGLVPLRHCGCADVVTQHGNRSSQFDSVEPTERGGQRSATGLAFASRRTWVVAQGAGLAGHSGKNARAHQHGASRPRMPRPRLLAQIGVRNLRHRGQRDRRATGGNSPNGRDAQQFLIEQHAMPRRKRQHNPPHDHVFARRFSLGRRKDFNLRMKKRLGRLKKRSDRRSRRTPPTTGEEERGQESGKIKTTDHGRNLRA